MKFRNSREEVEVKRSTGRCSRAFAPETVENMKREGRSKSARDYS
jgi:hypothetical protein